MKWEISQVVDRNIKLLGEKMDKELIKEMRKAIKMNDLNTVKSLIENNKGLIDEVTVFGTFLHETAKKDNLEMAQYFINQGIDVNKRAGTRDSGPLTDAAFKGNLDMVKLLYNNGAILDTSTFARNPLFAAIYDNNVSVAKFLIDEGIDIRVSYPVGSIENCDAYEYARQYGRTEIAEYLKEKMNEK